ncbi:MAG: bifunctional hydroxymethylpyrimidine kinase/phosphomethylpyrimidine kinase [Alphaproteobacteria bacterium]|nr:bifunctional hydroxymethylpyrimidine kinase/phosphomethylpyrimidine kinase [Alphaproteobacteria bacterium]
MSQLARVLIVAGSDCSGGAGIQADIKAVTALGGYAMTAITAITVQNTVGIAGIHEIPCETVADQMRVCLGDIGADVIKTGMLATAPAIEAVCAVIDAHARDVPLVVDPVMVSKGGTRLLDSSAMTALKAALILRASVITPNIPEAEVLSGIAIHSLSDVEKAGELLLSLGPKAVLIKGGHLPLPQVHDTLITPQGHEVYTSTRIETRATHGTGCTLASALATRLGQGLSLHAAVGSAISYVHQAIQKAPGFGKGHGPLNHAWAIRP